MKAIWYCACKAKLSLAGSPGSPATCPSCSRHSRCAPLPQLCCCTFFSSCLQTTEILWSRTSSWFGRRISCQDGLSLQFNIFSHFSLVSKTNVARLLPPQVNSANWRRHYRLTFRKRGKNYFIFFVILSTITPHLWTKKDFTWCHNLANYFLKGRSNILPFDQ